MATDRSNAREFSVSVVEQLRRAGYRALWAGGCVRDLLLGRSPKDFDVATDARPDQIRAVFGTRRTIPVGAAFGVITVIGPPGVGNIEVATFREDGGYSDGRHPDAVRFSSPELDAQRRDFTINGMFYDPLSAVVFDWVGGERDLALRQIRAIGDPHARFEEDKLRMLRGIRFAANFDFELDPATASAIRERAEEVKVVSLERITAELQRILTHESRCRGLTLLAETGLLRAVLPEVDQMRVADSAGRDDLHWHHPWQQTLALLSQWQQPIDDSLAWSGLLRWLPESARTGCWEERLKLPRLTVQAAEWLIGHESLLRGASPSTWPAAQRGLADRRGPLLLNFATAVAAVTGAGEESLAWCRERIGAPDWNPRPLLNGHDLQELGIPAGPAYRDLLERLRDAQLLGQVNHFAEALEWVRRQRSTTSPPE